MFTIFAFRMNFFLLYSYINPNYPYCTVNKSSKIFLFFIREGSYSEITRHGDEEKKKKGPLCAE